MSCHTKGKEMSMDKVNWNEGQIEVIKERGGWVVQHRARDGRLYSLDWSKFKNEALVNARDRAQKRSLKVLVEVV
jgi:hypothetical protein